MKRLFIKPILFAFFGCIFTGLFLNANFIAPQKNKKAIKRTGLKTIVIDAGHGGKDPGCAGSPKTESKVTLGVALKLGAYIEANLPDVKVVYTRKTDKFIELYERANIANRNNADLFISIHCNSMPTGTGKTVKGTEVYVMGMHVAGENLDIAKKMADRENKSILLEKDYKTHYDGYDPNDPGTHILLTMKQNVHLDQSIKVAQGIIDESKKLERPTRGVHQAGFVVIRATTMPSILVETGYLSNAQENAELQTAKGQSRIAKAIFRAVKAYKNDLEGKKKDDGGNTEIEPDGNAEEPIEPAETPQSSQPNEPKAETGPAGSAKNEPQKRKKSIKNAENTATNDNPDNTEVLRYGVSEAGSFKGTMYHVQVVSNDKPLAPNSILLRGLTDVREDFSDGRYRYVVGAYSTLSEAVAAAESYKAQGYKGAFPVRFVNGKRAK